MDDAIKNTPSLTKLAPEKHDVSVPAAVTKVLNHPPVAEKLTLNLNAIRDIYTLALEAPHLELQSTLNDQKKDLLGAYSLRLWGESPIEEFKKSLPVCDDEHQISALFY